MKYLGFLVIFAKADPCLTVYSTIIPLALTRARGGHESERNNNCFSKIQLVGQKYRDKTVLASKT